jgi:phage portal protein BeeE
MYRGVLLSRFAKTQKRERDRERDGERSTKAGNAKKAETDIVRRRRKVVELTLTRNRQIFTRIRKIAEMRCGRERVCERGREKRTEDKEKSAPSLSISLFLLSN